VQSLASVPDAPNVKHGMVPMFRMGGFDLAKMPAIQGGDFSEMANGVDIDLAGVGVRPLASSASRRRRVGHLAEVAALDGGHLRQIEAAHAKHGDHAVLPLGASGTEARLCTSMPAFFQAVVLEEERERRELSTSRGIRVVLLGRVVARSIIPPPRT